MADSRPDPSISKPASSDVTGMSFADILLLPDVERQVVNWMLRQPAACSLAAIARQLNQPEDQVQEMVRSLIQRGFMREVSDRGETCYQLCITSMRSRRLAPRVSQLLSDD
ncbi:MAG TPA: hypothetical protein V6C88_11175 [Chroococcidiopsis sp.]